MRILPLLLLPLLSLAPPAEPTVPPAGKIQTLLITGQNRHDWRAVSPVLRQMLEGHYPL